MKQLEIRRHSMRKTGGGSQLSQEGVTYARRLGAKIGPFAQVVTSVVPRTRETALAMGFAVDYELVTMPIDADVFAELEANRWWDPPTMAFAALAQLIASKGACWRYAHTLAAAWRDLINAIPDHTSALFIGHSGELEMALVACFPQADHASWGAPIGLCEGARLVYGGEPERFTTCELLRH